MQDRYETFTALIDNLKKNIRKIKAAEMQNYELKGSHISFIYYLYTSNSTMTSKKLAEVCNEDKASVSRSIEYLEEQGYLVCEKQNHKAIIIGKQGKALKETAGFAREGMEKFLGAKVFLEVFVKVKEDWRNRPDRLKEYGYSEEELF